MYLLIQDCFHLLNTVVQTQAAALDATASCWTLGKFAKETSTCPFYLFSL